MKHFVAMLLAAVALGLGLVAAQPQAALAFPNEQFWHMAADGVAGTNRAGAGGIYGTGGHTDYSVRCSHCHIADPGATHLIDARITATPAFYDRGGGDLGYEPGRAYAIVLDMLGEHERMTPAAMDVNGFALAIENASGRPSGRMVSDAGHDSSACPATNPYPMAASRPAGRTTMMWGDCHAMLFIAFPRLTRWTFTWTAPAAGAGDLTIYLGMVDGDTGGESSLDDDAIERTYALREGP